MSTWLDRIYYGNTLTEWMISLAIIAGAFIVSKTVYWVFGGVIKALTKRTKTKLDDLIIDMIEEPIVLIITVFGIRYGMSRLTFPEAAAQWIAGGTQFLVVLAIAWLAARLLDAIYQEYLAPLADQSENTLDDQLLPILRRATRFVVWSLGIVVALNNAGYDVGALIAGLGIGGLALAMAAKDSVSNIFGGFTIFTDKPFTLGDRINVDGYDGTVAEIGLRSTRVRLLDGRLVTIPNSRFSEAAVENVSAEPSRKVVTTLGLTYDMKPEQMQQAMDILKSITDAHDSVADGAKTGFAGFGDFSMNILLIYYISSGEDILGTQTDINLEILRHFNDNGLDMAFPTQTIHSIKS